MNIKKVLLKFSLFFFIFLSLIFGNINRIYIEYNNKSPDYEGDIDFSNLTTHIKAIALYLPQFHESKMNNQFWGKGFTEWTNVKRGKPKYQGHHQPRSPGDIYGYLGYYDLKDIKVFENQVNLAKKHGIYGFGIYYYWFSGKHVLQKPLNNFIKHSYIEFHFLLIWANENWTRKWNGGDYEILIKQEYKTNDPQKFIRDIKKYINDKRYIRIDNKPVLGLYEPSKIPNLRETISIWREKSRVIGIGDIFVLICMNKNKTQDFQRLNLFDGAYEFPPRNSFENLRIPNKRTLIYSELLYKSSSLNETKIDSKRFLFFRGSMVEWDNSARTKNCEIFENYSPEQFYIFNKMIVNWTKIHYNKDYQFIFINAWNEWGEGSYLEPDDKYGYASINSLSKAIFNLSYSEILTNIGENRIVVIMYLNEEYLREEMINKINNIPYIYELFIFINNKINKDNLRQYIRLYSNAYYYEIRLINNERNYLLPFLYNFRNKAKYYKYICNINSIHLNNIDYFNEWKNYIYNNLVGNSIIISEIISDMEKNNEIGLIFPEIYYKSKVLCHDNINDLDLEYLNFFLRKFNCKENIKEKIIDFPEGNMFWAKISAIHQIFNINPDISYTKNIKLMIGSHLEKIWVFLVKINGFLYKKIFKHL